MTKMFQDIYEDIKSYLLNGENWLNFSVFTMKILAIIIGSWLLVKIGRKAIRRVFSIRTKGPMKISERRETTLQKLLENILSYIVYFIALIMLFDNLGYDVTGLIAGAGVLGLAIGFGAQSLVKDVISGFFIIFEDQFSVGDYIKIADKQGFVEEIGLRTTKIKSWTGELHVIPNGNIAEVTNYSVNNSIAVVDVSIAYEGDIVEAESVIERLLEELPFKYEEMVGTPQLLGVQTLGASDVVLRVISETKPMEHWKIGRMLRKEIKLCLDEHNIEIPFPRLVMYSREEEESLTLKEGGHMNG
ncbi:mechanosensitive ion channel family protein [Bacillus carboniphilus]|uniref:Mechanosensitive ion channel family protein n=1 Tax=Bacillus carboniphilus TaxID=86663 RepID=A0ABY9JRB9_9BACI|nr:mechanosensitive ion channel family protein [Bacillus carboniphilus]WLR41877.1 mechanosensitive ion channel family protein [Bacillus carboniphilus]